MKMNYRIAQWLALLALSTLTPQFTTLFAQGTAFSYQGRLDVGGNPANGSYDIQFMLYATNLNGSPVAGPVTNLATAVSNGLFSSAVDFGPGVFSGTEYWLDLAVRTNGGGAFTELTPRQAVTPAPYAIFATSAGNVPGLVVQPNADGAPNVVAGSPVNFVESGVVGATVGGGGATNYIGSALINSVSGNFGTVSGGAQNSARGAYATVGGGYTNTAGFEATVGGGYDNTASGENATVGGGVNNIASSFWATVGGGVNNIASGEDATVGGGQGNSVSDNFGTVSGGAQNAASGAYATVGGGANNTTSNMWATVGGGYYNTASGTEATVGGGNYNTASTSFATVGGGTLNTASGGSATVGGGYGNTASNEWATVGGGTDNIASGQNATVGGGEENIASTTFAIVGGGAQNTASGGAATVGGGNGNTASGGSATVGGGYYNTATNEWATVGGGYYNTATNNYATVPGGCLNLAGGQYSFAAGYNAHAVNSGAFVWSDGTGTATPSTVANQFVARASGGFVFYSSTLSAGVSLAAGGGSWSSLSDRNAKDHLTPVNSQTVLAQVAALPLTTWSYKTEPGVRHVGPMAQDFYNAFGVGEDDKHITEVDEGGVALAAIQGLDQKLKEKDGEIQNLKQQNDSLAERLNELEALVKQLATQK
jgi:hypothetical protein